jgi:MFS family permease
MLLFALGVILPAGTGAMSFGIIMGTLTPKLGERRAAAVSGLVTAASGIGSSVLSPTIRKLLSICGFMRTTAVLCIFILLLLPVAYLLGRNAAAENSAARKRHSTNIPQIFKGVLQSRTFILLTIGFFACGFHMAIIETHLYSQFVSYGIPASSAALAFSAFGIATITGSVVSGFACTRVKMKNVLAFLYAFRVAIAAAFLCFPKVPVTAFVFSVFFGLTGAATVIPTSGLVGRTFGSEKLGTLFGVVFFSHQIGGFFSAWLGGISVSLVDSRMFIWSVDIALCLIASAASFKILESVRTVYSEAKS